MSFDFPNFAPRKFLQKYVLCNGLICNYLHTYLGVGE